MKLLFLILSSIVLLSIVVPTCNGQMQVETANNAQILKTAAEDLKKVATFITEAKPGKILANLAKSLSALGPAMMLVSSVLSVITMFLPKEDSPELKAIKEGFAKVNRKMDVLTNEIENLESVVKLSAAKSAYAKTISVIKENYRIYVTAFNSSSKSDLEYFKLNYENTFGMATTHLYDAMVGANGAFGFNLVQLYSDSVKCNPVKISNFCIMGMDLINRGLACESAYLGIHNFTAQVKAKQSIWKEKLETLGSQCTSIVDKCEAEWESRSQNEFIAMYKKHLSDNHPQYVAHIINSVSDIVPQRKWFGVVYSDAGGFGEHCFSSYYKVSKVWNEHKKDVTIFSTPQSKTDSSQEKSWIAMMENKVSQVSSGTYCNNGGWKSKNSGNQSRSLVEIIRKSFFNGVVYSVDVGKKPACHKSAGFMLVKKVKWACKNQFYQLMMFQ